MPPRALAFLHGLAGARHLLAVIPALGAAGPMGAVWPTCWPIWAGRWAAMRGRGQHLVVSHHAQWCSNAAVVVGCTGALSIATGAFWLQKTSAV